MTDTEHSTTSGSNEEDAQDHKNTTSSPKLMLFNGKMMYANTFYFSFTFFFFLEVLFWWELLKIFDYNVEWKCLAFLAEK